MTEQSDASARQEAVTKRSTRPTLLTTQCLQQHFHDEVQHAVEQHQIHGENDTVWYLGNLLTDYAHSSRFFDYSQENCTLTPLAEYYRQAVEASSENERRLHLQRLGDVALFITSLFSGALERRAVGIDYYMSMGESAYGSLANADPVNSRDRALADIFADLASQFSDYVAALAELTVKPDHQQTLLSLIEQWEANGHPRLERQLRQQGVFVRASESSH